MGADMHDVGKESVTSGVELTGESGEVSAEVHRSEVRNAVPLLDHEIPTPPLE